MQCLRFNQLFFLFFFPKSVFLFKAQILKILSVIYRLVQSNSYATKRFFINNPYFTKANIQIPLVFIGMLEFQFIYFFSHNSVCLHRDIYYNNTKLFGSQKAVDSIVDDISCMLKVPRRSLHVVSVHVCVSRRCGSYDCVVENTNP